MGAAVLALLWGGDVGALQAQTGAITAAMGTSIPRGTAGERYDLGLAGRLSADYRHGSRLAFRLDAEASRMAGDKLESYPDDLRTYGASLNALWRFEGSGYTPYLLVGAGGYRLQRVGAAPSVYDTTPAVQAGLGLEVSMSAATALVFEMRATAHLTDYASSEFAPTVVWPLMAGLRWKPWSRTPP